MAIRFVILLSLMILSSQHKAGAQETVFNGNIVGEFSGWSGETLFELSDGTFWIQASYAYTYSYAYNPRAKIVKSGVTHYLIVDGVGSQIAVKPIKKVIKSRINGNFEGFSGDSIYTLMDGSVWQQSQYKYAYKYAYSPNVLLYQIGSTWKMQVGDLTVSVARLK